MAINSRNRRASAIEVAAPWRVIHPAPFGTIDAAARLQVGWSYKGIAADPPPVSTFNPAWAQGSNRTVGFGIEPQ